MGEIQIDYFGEEFESDNHEDAIKWLEENKQRLLACQKAIADSPFSENLEARFLMWDASCKYWSEDVVCVVTAKDIHIVSNGYGDPSEGTTHTGNVGSVNLDGESI